MLRKWLGAHSTPATDGNWRAKSPEALMRFMEGGGASRPRGVELGSETRLAAPGVGSAGQMGSGASADWLLAQQARRHDALDELIQVHRAQ